MKKYQRNRIEDLDFIYDLPVSILESFMTMLDDLEISIPSVFGLSSGAIIWSLEMSEPLH